MKKINVGVIGVGNMGKHHARIYSELDETNLIAISDIDESIGQKISSLYNCKYYNDYIELLKDKNIEAVSIAVPTKLHKKVALDAIKFKKNILLEKPIAEAIEDAHEIIDKAKKTKIKLFIGHIERFNPAVQKLKSIVDSGRLGKLTSIIARRVGLPPAKINDTNVLLDLAVHDIDVINYLLNKEPNIIYASSGNAVISHTKDRAEIFLKYGDISTFIQVNWITPIKIRNLSITGTTGYAELDYINQKIILYENNPGPTNLKFETYEDFLTKFAPDRIEIGINKEEPLKNELKSFINSIQNNIDPTVSGEEAALALKIALESLNQDDKLKK